MCYLSPCNIHAIVHWLNKTEIKSMKVGSIVKYDIITVTLEVAYIQEMDQCN